MIYIFLFTAPSKPENISALILNPTLAEVSWSPPKEINGEFVHYEIHWQTESNINSIRQKGEQIVMEPEKSDSTTFKTHLFKLSPNENYSIWIRAYSETNDTYSDSNSVNIQTFPEPDNITLLNSSAYELNLQWNLYTYADTSVMQYTTIGSSEWFNVEEKCIVDDEILNITLSDLKPKTQYKFRLALTYPKYKNIYIWPSDTRFTFETLGKHVFFSTISIQTNKLLLFKKYFL